MEFYAVAEGGDHVDQPSRNDLIEPWIPAPTRSSSSTRRRRARLVHRGLQERQRVRRIRDRPHRPRDQRADDHHRRRPYTIADDILAWVNQR
ncbi:hypothetical protein NKG05_25640 [Oerskovia sp. M15]